MVEITHEFKDGTRRRGLSANVASEALLQIEKRDNGITPEAVVVAAKPKRSPLHDYFEWDDSVAAHEYRIEQARYLIRHLIVKVEGERPEPRAFLSISRSEDSERVYRNTIDVVQTPELRDQIIERAKEDLNVWRRRYATLLAFSKIGRLLDQLTAALDAHNVARLG